LHSVTAPIADVVFEMIFDTSGATSAKADQMSANERARQ
jgi:hypothetical protein